jgi:hypothetical protein
VRKEPVNLAADHSPSTSNLEIHGTFTAQSGECPMVATGERFYLIEFI